LNTEGKKDMKFNTGGVYSDRLMLWGAKKAKKRTLWGSIVTTSMGGKSEEEEGRTDFLDKSKDLSLKKHEGKKNVNKI